MKPNFNSIGVIPKSIFDWMKNLLFQCERISLFIEENLIQVGYFVTK